MSEKPTYYAIIPAEVRYCEELDFGARLLYGEIASLTNKEGFCWANNAYFAELFKVSERTVTGWVSDLVRLRFLTMELGKSEHGSKRKLFLWKQVSTPIEAEFHPPVEVDFYHNSTSNNIKINTTEHARKNIFGCTDYQDRFYAITGRAVSPHDKMRLNYFNLTYGAGVLMMALEAVGEKFAVKSLSNVEIMCRELTEQHLNGEQNEEKNYGRKQGRHVAKHHIRQSDFTGITPGFTRTVEGSG